MHKTVTSAILVFVALAAPASADEDRLIEPMRPYVKQVVDSIESLPQKRKQLLSSAADYAVERIARDESAKFVFICTHNSRRSHLSQVWCQVAAAYYEVPGLEAYSGGTETTACNVRTVRALRRAGLSIAASTDGINPVYLVQYSESLPPTSAYSKVYTDKGNPSTGFAAMLCCSDADRQCPRVKGADRRFALHYLDPKSADNTAEESDRYDERCLQIAREMFYFMSQVAEKIE